MNKIDRLKESAKFFVTIEKITSFMTHKYGDEIIEAKKELGRFTESKVVDPKRVRKYLTIFEEGTEKAETQIRVLRNIMISRIGTFSSNYDRPEAKVVGYEDIYGDYITILDVIGKQRQLIVEHYNEVVKKMEGLQAVLAKEMKLVRAMEGNESLVEHLEKAKQLSEILRKEEIPTYKDLMKSIPYDTHQVKKSIKVAKVKCRSIKVFFRNHVYAVKRDFERLDSPGARLGVSVIAGLAMILYIARFHKKVLYTVGGSLATFITVKLFGNLDDISPVFKELFQTMGIKASDFSIDSVGDIYDSCADMDLGGLKAFG